MEQLKSFAEFNRRYRVGQELGRGASSVCYKIIDTVTQQQFAMKKIEYRLITDSKTTILQQINILKRISHKNIIKFIEAYQDNTSVYIIMQYNKDKDLHQLIKSRKQQGRQFTYSQIWKIFRQILQGIIYMHRKQVIHRDIKPSNIFLNQDLQVKIGDLGAAKLVQVNQQNYTRIGTPYYLPPEIIKCDQYSFKADIWSLGVTIYYLTIMQLPFQASQVISYQQPSYPTTLPLLLLSAIQDMLQKKQQHRPSAQELYDKYCVQQQILSMNQIASDININQDNQQEQQQKWKVINDIELPEIHQPILEKKQTTHLFRRDSMHMQELNKQNQKTINQPLNNLTSLKYFSDTKRCSVGQIQPVLPQLDDEDKTIVLTVNPNEHNNFSCYYKQSSRSSFTYFNNSNIDEKQKLKSNRNSSIFKRETNDLANNRSSLFQYNKQNKKIVHKISYASTHLQQQSLISAKKKHKQLMLKLKPLKPHQNSSGNQIKQKLRKVIKPELILIENQAPIDI